MPSRIESSKTLEKEAWGVCSSLFPKGKNALSATVWESLESGF
jgi:hypothetical protein